LGTLEGRDIVRARIVIFVVGLSLLGLVSGCSFFGGDEPNYTHWEPALSPDGRALVYESPTEESLELFLRDLETGEERRLTQNEHPDWSPTWAPFGDRVAFASSRDKNVDIYVVNLADLSIERLTTHEDDDINPDWGNDGRVYFNSNRSGVWEIYAIDPIDRALVKITQAAEPAGS
jgi:Tol biopolymer transport system component